MASNLTNTKPQAEGFYNTLSATRRFAWGDDLAWDEDFEQKNVGSPAAGTDVTWADDVDMVFFSGHGAPEEDSRSPDQDVRRRRSSVPDAVRRSSCSWIEAAAWMTGC